MANPGVGSKFVSVNLNKSYGQPSNSSGPSRVRSGGHGVGSGMVVLSRHRSSIMGAQKSGPKLSVPPPLNLPSLRKEHERFDSSSSGGGATGSGTSGSGSRPSSSGMGWSKPGPSNFQEKDAGDDHQHISRAVGGSQIADGGNLSSYSSDGRSRGGSGSVYMPPSARSGTVGPPVAHSSRPVPVVEKAVVLKGEDFPSLQATLPSASGSVQKQQDSLNQKQKQKLSEEAFDEQKDNSYSGASLHMRPQVHSSRLTVGNNSDENGGVAGSSSTVEQSRKQDSYFPGPLPLVRLQHTSDWADDERDTGYSLSERDRDYGYSRSESIREKEYDFPRVGAVPRTSVPNLSDGRGVRDDEAGKGTSGEFLRGNTYSRDVRTPSREGRDGSSWRVSPISKDGFSTREIGIDRNGAAAARPSNSNWEMNRETKHNVDNSRDGFNSGVTVTQEFKSGRRDAGYGQGGRQNGSMDSFSGRGAEQNVRNRFNGDQSNRYRGNFFQNSLIPKAPFSLGSKGFHVNDPVLNFVKEKRSASAKPYLEDPFLKDIVSGPGFDGRDPLTGGLVGVFKRKKDVAKQADFHDPIRESFEAELERVQKIQEQERQRIVEEQARALELARKEEEERERLAREEEERRRRLEEEARAAAWRAEQERLEAVRRTEEQKIAREEEKRRILMEEERRKEAARKKLMELEARIARRQTETVHDDKFSAAVRDDKMLGVVKERDVPRVADVVDWEDGERMVERITSSASSDSSNLNRSFEMGSRPPFSRDGDSGFLDRGKPANAWRRDVFEHGNSSNFVLQDQENDYRSPRRDTFGAGRAFSRKEFYGGSGVIAARSSSKGGISEPHAVDEFPHMRGHRWNLAGDGDHYGRNSEIDPEYYDNSADNIGWGQGRSRGSPRASYPERLYQNFEADGFSAYSRSRHSMRQPRVLPPPSLASMHKDTTRAEMEHSSSSAFMDGEMRYHHGVRKNESIVRTGYGNGYQERIEQPRMMDVQRETIPQEQKVEKATSPRCDSQSSLSVSSPPDSPVHLSHDDLENSGDSPVLTTAAKGEEISLSDNEHDFSVAEVGNTSKMTTSSAVSAIEDEDWPIENDEELQEQEEYDEEDGYLEEDEVQEGDDENIDLSQEYEDLHLEVKEASDKMGQMVLGFDGGVEVGIPSGDEFERSSRNGDLSVGMQQVSVGALEEGSFNGLVGTGQTIMPENSSLAVSMDSSNNMVQETENAVQDMALQPGTVSHYPAASAGFLLDSVEASNSSCLPAQQIITSSSVALSSPVIQPITPTVSAGVSQAEAPVNLQFGLFSGPSLIPSPVPAIQIGSIQMPLHIHPQMGPSLSHMHPSQPPFFQFGQLRYGSPISQGILPLAPQSVSFVQPSVATHYSFNQNHEGPVHIPAGQDSSTKTQLTESSVLLDDQPGVPKLLELSRENAPKEVNVLSVRRGPENEVLTSQNRAQISLLSESESRSKSLAEDQGHHDMSVKKNSRYVANNKESQGQVQPESARSQFISKAPGPISGSKGKRFIYTVKNSGSKPSVPVSEATHADFSGFQRRPRQKFRRTEFRVRENVEKRQTEGLGSSVYSGMDEKLNLHGKMSGISVRNGVKKDSGFNKPTKQMVESDGLNSDSIGSCVDSESKTEKRPGKEAPTKRLTSSFNISRSGEGNPKRNSSSVEDVDAPMQSGIVRVFRQPGIETPSDEDDFIEVRSKRQMLNDRREQREKEIKAKSRVIKASRKPRSVSQNTGVPAKSNKTSTSSLVGESASSITSSSLHTDRQGLANVEVGSGFTNSIVSQPLAPIGTPATVNSEAQAVIRSHSMKSLSTGSIPVVSNGGTNLAPGLSFDNKNVALDNVATSLGSWGSARINQQVMTLTQTQLDDAMKTARFDSHVACIGDHTSAAIDRSKPSPSILTQEKSFSSTASPLSSLLAGEKIQFGAVTSPTILPSSSRVVSSGIGPPGSCRPDVTVDHTLSAVESGCTFFEKEQHPDESCVHLDDPEAEAEAAASAVAVAAISSDEIVGSGLGACSVSTSDTKGFGGADIEGLASGGGAGNQQLASQSQGEESLTVALPADLSVETPSLSLWPPLPSPQNSSSQMLSHFPGGPPSHFPCYEMNPMLGAPIFAFAPHDESSGTESQSQKNNTSGSGPLGAWQQCHSGVDSFYGPPAGFTGPFISPSGGIPGVQGPPHMVVYNHFTPVGQFGQVGLSFMGTTYIPSGKQPDWKHNPTSTMGIGEGDVNNLNITSAQRNPPSIPAPIQHLAPGSPLLPLASPFAMFDMSPFQSSTDVPVQARWSHVPASHLHSVPLSMPLQQQAEGGLPPQFSHGLSMDQSTGSRFHDPCSLAPQDTRRNFPVSTDATTAVQFPDELGLVDPSSSTGARILTSSRPTSFSSTNNGNANKVQSVVAKSSSRNTTGNNVVGGGSGGIHNNNNSGGSNSSSSQSISSAHKNQSTTTHQQHPSQQQHYLHQTGYNTDQRGSGVSHKVGPGSGSGSGSGGEWSHRRMGGFQGRNQSSGTDKQQRLSKAFEKSLMVLAIILGSWLVQNTDAYLHDFFLKVKPSGGSTSSSTATADTMLASVFTGLGLSLQASNVTSIVYKHKLLQFLNLCRMH
ncbi:hypothetical protein BVC80_1825g52 [Macleaya cordata]|uniref:Uncharacterized protein n=1 Tax=Macleaya cordata TaxID=56857 RepID=A0A200QZG0_MACCD|nr:hypothetical protein BVC80_1825g52 [Macleaya cordata]